MKFTRKLSHLILAAGMALPAFAIAQSDEVTVTRLKRPSKQFLDYGDVIGVSPDLLRELGIREGDPVRVEAALGAYIGVGTKTLGDQIDTIYAKKTIREMLGVEDGETRLKISAIEWSDESPQSETATFTRVEKPPVAFLVHGDAVGVSLRRILELGGQPGSAVELRSQSGTTRGSLQLLDRGYDVIVMKETMRDSLGVDTGSATVTMRVLDELAETGSPTKSLYWYHTFAAARQRAMEDTRPLFIYVESTGSDGSAEGFEQLMSSTGAQVALLKARKHRFTLGDNPALERQLKITSAPTMLFLTPELEEISRFEEMPKVADVMAAGSEATRRVSNATPENSQPVRWHPYNVGMINQALTDTDSALIYVRLDVAENCEEFERTYLFGEAGNRLLGGKNAFFFDAGKNPLLANQFKVSYAPTLILLKSDGSPEKLEVTKNTNPAAILEFFRRLDEGK